MSASGTRVSPVPTTMSAAPSAGAGDTFSVENPVVADNRPSVDEGADKAGETPATGGRNWKKIAIVAAIVLLIITIIVDSFTSKIASTALNDFLEWFKGAGWFGVLCFFLVYVFGTVTFLPGSVLTIGAGFAFSRTYGTLEGVLLGTLVVLISATVGATIAFLLGRYALRSTVSEWAKKYRVLTAVDAAMAEQGLKVITLLRLSPLIPFNAFNYIAGLTGVSLCDYVIGSVGMVPGTTAFVYLGSLVSDLGESSGDDDNMAVRIVLFVVGLVATIVAVVFVSVLAKRQLNAALALDEEGETKKPVDIELGSGSTVPADGKTGTAAPTPVVG